MTESTSPCAVPTTCSTESSARVAPESLAPGAGPTPGASASPVSSVSSARLVAVLAGGGAIAGLLLVIAYFLTLEPIRAHRAKILSEGIREVLGLSEKDSYDSFWLQNEAITTKEPADRRAADLWRGSRADGTVVGWALPAGEPGFADEIRLIVGWDAKARRILALKILEQKETPGLGDEIQNDPSFSRRFAGRQAPVRGIKRGAGTGAATEVDTITGATISSRAVIRIVNHAVERWQERIDALREEAPR